MTISALSEASPIGARVLEYAATYRPAFTRDVLERYAALASTSAAPGEECLLATAVRVVELPGSRPALGLLLALPHRLSIGIGKESIYRRPRTLRLRYHDLTEVRTLPEAVPGGDPGLSLRTAAGPVGLFLPRRLHQQDIDPMHDELTDLLLTRAGS